MRAAALTLLLPLAGCAMRGAAGPAPSALSSSAAPARAVETPTEPVSADVARPSSAGGAMGQFSIAPIASLPGGGASPTAPGTFEDPGAQRDARIALWEREIVRQHGALGASLAQCREVCIATSNVCTAAHEICRLTGDLAHANARDVRCARARGACVDASRRRDGACPVCPAR